MTVNELAQKLNLELIHNGSPDRQIKTCYVGDLLSWVMGRAGSDCAWITIMSNINVAAVSEMIEASCIILAEGVNPDDSLMKKFDIIGASVYKTPMSAYEVSWKIHEVLGV